MAWVQKGRGHYYYQSKRVGRTVRSEYIGSGDFAALIAQMDAITRQEAQDKRQADKGIVEQEKATDEQIAALVQAADNYIKALMLLADYHQHKRQWRRKRDNRG